MSTCLRDHAVSRLLCAAALGALSAAFLLGPAASPALATSPDIVISQVYGGGGNSGAPYKNDFIELFNRGSATVPLTGWSLQYASATGSFGTSAAMLTLLSGSLAPGQRWLVQEAAGAGSSPSLPTPDLIAADPISMSATAGKVALVRDTAGLNCGSGTAPCSPAQLALIIDLIGYGTTANLYEGSGRAPAPSNTTADIRVNAGCADTDNNATDFAAATPTPRNSASPLTACTLAGTGAATPAVLLPGEASLLTVFVTPVAAPPSTGIAVTADLTAIGGSATQTFFDDGTSGDVTAGDNTFSFSATVAGGTSLGLKAMPASISDAQARTASATINLNVVEMSAPHDIQGPGSTSPVADQVVIASGVVTAVKSNGFFIQTPDGEKDADTATSEAVFVFTSSAPPPAAALGNEVRVAGTVQEYVPSADPWSPPMTEIVSPTVAEESTGNSLPEAITLTAADTDPAGSLEQLERYEGMRVNVASLTAVAPTQGSVTESSATSISNGVFYGVITGVARPFREPGIQVPDPLPIGAPCCVPSFDGNPERLRVDSDGQVGASPLDVTTDTVVTDLIGVLDYAYRTYTILPDPATPPGVGAPRTATAVPAPSAEQFTIASFNLARFFDTVDDAGKSDAVLTPAAFDHRLAKVSLAIRDMLLTPDILGVEEVEKLTTLQAIAARLSADAVAAGQPDPAYQASLVEGNDPGGIDVGFLTKGGSVAIVGVTQEGAGTTYIDPNTGLPATLNDRPPLVLRALVTVPPAPAYPVTVIVNHLRSLSAVNDPADGARVRAKRRAQAEYLANLIQGYQQADPNEPIVSLGDYNAFSFNDGYVDSMGTIKGSPTAPDQVVLASSDLVTPDLVDAADTLAASERYSYSYDGHAQTLDHLLITSNMLARLDGLSHARINADFPDILRNDAASPGRTSDHDPLVAYFSTPPVVSIDDVTVTEGSGGTTSAVFTLTLSKTNAGVVTVDYATADGTATAASGDYVATSGTVSFGVGATSQTLAIQVTGDLDYENTETFTVDLSNPGDAIVGDPQGQVTINDNDVPPSLSINDAAATEGDSGSTPLVFTVSLSAANEAAAVTVNYATASGTATAGSDFTATGGTLTFAPGETSNTVSVNVLGDTSYEADETFSVNLNSPSGASLMFSQGQGVIWNDDSYPTISVGDVTQVEGNSGTTAFDFVVTLSNPVGQLVQASYATADGTAAAGSDYTAASGIVSFAAGQTSKTVSALVNGDSVYELNEALYLNLSNPVNVVIADGQGMGTISNDDSKIYISIDDVSLSEGDSGTSNAVFTVSIAAPISSDVTVDYTTVDGTAAAGSDYAWTGGTLTIPAGQTSATLTVSVNGDTVLEGDETFYLNLSNASPAAALFADYQGLGTITNDDAGTPTLSISSVSATEGNIGAKAFTFTVSLSVPSATPVTVKYATANGTARVPSDYRAVTGTLTIAAGETSKTVTVQVIGDRLREAAEVFYLNLSAPSGATIASGTGRGVILNDD